jgi:prepilin-type processing-associated H-X9-DG protein
MQTKGKIRWIIILTFYFFFTLNVLASDSTTGLDKLLKPCIDDQTFAVIHVDAGKFNLDALVAQILEIAKKHPNPDIANEMQKELKTMQTKVDTRLKTFLEAGGRDIFVVFSMYDFPYFFVVIPINSTNDQADINQKIELYQYVEKITEDEFNGINLHISDNLILAGLEQTIERLKTISAVQSDTLAKGFEACGDTTVQLVLFPSQDQHRIMAEMLPQLDSGSDTLKLETPINELDWIALGIDMPPSLSINLTIQSTNQEAADRMLTFVKSLYVLIGQMPQAREIMPELDQLLQRLTPHVQDEQLRLLVDSKDADSIIDEFITPSLMKVRTTTTRFACAQNLSGIGKALLIYANDYDDNFPPNLEILTTTVEVTQKTLVCPATKLKDSYIYRGATLSTSEAPFIIMVYEKSGNHGEGRNVLFLDSHVDWVTDDRFRELIEQDNEYRRKKELPIIPAD